MLLAFCHLALSFPLAGRWVGNFTTSSDDNFTFSITFRFQGVRFKGTTKAPKQHKFLPKHVDVREIRVNRTFVILLPFQLQEKYAEIDLVELPTGILSGNATSDDNSCNLSLSIFPENTIELEILNLKHLDWYRYVLYQRNRSVAQGRANVIILYGFPAAAVAVILYLISTLFRQKGARKHD